MNCKIDLMSCIKKKANAQIKTENTRTYYL